MGDVLVKAKHGATFRCALASLLTGCPMPPSGDDEVAATESSDSSATSVDTTETADDGGCPVGIEGCPCTDVSSCFPSLECVDDVCVPADPCPVGESGCPCTNFGTCDPGSTCEAGVCSCEVGQLGCECLDGGCSNALDCVDGVCSIPELVSEAADGWGPVTCRTQRGSNLDAGCTAPRGDVFQHVISACEVAERLQSGDWVRTSGWVTSEGFDVCALDLPVPDPQSPWEDIGCFVAEFDLIGCWGRIGHLWTRVTAMCSIPSNDFGPWLPVQEDAYGCLVDSPPPVSNDIDEWRCGMHPDLDITAYCRARRGNFWTDPRPPCWDAYLDTVYDLANWSSFDCSAADG
jgi:hypothetical protein